MKYLRVIDQDGNKFDYETEFVPRIGERVLLAFPLGRLRSIVHHYRVKDVMYRLTNPVGAQVAILIEEEVPHTNWPD
jgi:hypothetical protein